MNKLSLLPSDSPFVTFCSSCLKRKKKNKKKELIKYVLKSPAKYTLQTLSNNFYKMPRQSYVGAHDS